MNLAAPLSSKLHRPLIQTTIGNICDRFDGEVQTGPFGSQLHASDYSEAGIPVVMPQDMVEGKVSCDRISRVDESHAERLNQHRLRAGDIVFSRRGDVSRFAVITGREAGWLCGTGSIRIRLNCPDIDTDYLRHFLSQDMVGDWLLYHAKGVTMPNLNTTIIRAIPLSYPPLDEQRRIAAILDKADALRRKRKRAIELLEELKHSIFLEIFGAVDRFPTISVGQSLLQPFRNGLSPAKAGTFAGRVLTLSAITSGVFEPIAVKEAMFAAEPPINQRVSRGEFLICRGNGNRSLVGIGVFAPCSMPDTLFPDTIIAGKIDPDRFHPRYFQDVWNGNFVRSQIEKSARTTNGTFKVNQSGLEAISIPMPDISLQAAYGDKTASIEQAKSLALTQHNFLDSLFSSLQHRAFSGQL